MPPTNAWLFFSLVGLLCLWKDWWEFHCGFLPSLCTEAYFLFPDYIIHNIKIYVNIKNTYVNTYESWRGGLRKKEKQSSDIFVNKKQTYRGVNTAAQSGKSHRREWVTPGRQQPVTRLLRMKSFRDGAASQSAEYSPGRDKALALVPSTARPGCYGSGCCVIASLGWWRPRSEV